MSPTRGGERVTGSPPTPRPRVRAVTPSPLNERTSLHYIYAPMGATQGVTAITPSPPRRTAHPPFHAPSARACPSLRGSSSVSSRCSIALERTGCCDHRVTSTPGCAAAYGIAGRDVTADHVPSALEHALAGLVPWFQAEDEERA